jgi:hypothetical protein
MVEFGVTERDPGEPRQVRDLVTGNGHACILGRLREQPVSNKSVHGDS